MTCLWRTWATSALCLLLAACSSDGSGPAADGGPTDAVGEGLTFVDGQTADGPTADASAPDGAASDGPVIGDEPLELTREDCLRRAQSGCSFATRCWHLAADRWDDCLAQLRGDCEKWVEALAEGAAAGRLDHDGAAERDCYAERERISCAEAELLNCIGGATEGKVAEGDPCYDQRECLDTHYCAYVDACPGSCQPRVGEGQDCSAARCLLDLRCAVEGQCVVREEIAAGDPCDPLRPDLQVCALGTDCQVSDDGSHRCLVPQPVDGPCATVNDCVYGLICVLPRELSATDPGRCRTAAAEGDSCSLEGECVVGLRCVDDDQDAATRRSCAQPLGVGAECTGLLDRRVCTSEGCHTESACADGERCFPDEDPATSHCGPVHTEGQACAKTTQCVDGLTCYQAPAEEVQHCHGPGAVGDYCLADSCGAGLFCNEVDRCEAENQRAVGQPCPSIVPYCASGLYCHGDQSCQPQRDRGDDCDSDLFGQCAPPLGCRFGKCRHNCS